MGRASWIAAIGAIEFGLIFSSSLMAQNPEVPSVVEGYVGQSTVIPVKLMGMAAKCSQLTVMVPDTIRKGCDGDDQLVLQAPVSIPSNVLYVDSKVQITTQGGGMAEFTFRVGPESGLEWESRAIIGWHQAGASSTNSSQHLFIDFFVARPFGSGAVYDSPFNLWGQVRVASSPQQKTIPLQEFAASFVAQLGGVKVNELAQSAEFLTGVEYRPKKWTGKRIRTFGLVGFFGANGAFSDPATQGRVFRVPPLTSPQWANFVSRFKDFQNDAFRQQAQFIGLVPPDRERFYREYGFGVRYTSYIADQKWASPAMFTATLGQDQSITRGRYVGPVLKFDAFYPLPLSLRKNEPRFVYFFGTANLAVAKPDEKVPLALELVQDCPPNTPQASVGTTCSVPLHQNNVAIFTVPSARDTYRIGVGIDVIAFFKALKLQ